LSRVSICQGSWLRVLCVLACLHSAAARADEAPSPDVESRARAHYTAGRTLYQLGNYTDALRELLLGYALIPKYQFLLNMGQCYRRLDDPAKAREMYRKFLQEAPPEDANRPQVETLMRELDQQIAERARVTSPPANANTLVATPTTTPPRRNVGRTLAWAIPVAVVAAAGLSVGLYFALRPTCSGLVCIDAGGGMQ
jgi:tetratricopeptide (TPR) repeat protein